MSDWNQQQQQQRQPAVSFAAPARPSRGDGSRGPFADQPPPQGNHPYLGLPTSEYAGSSSSVNVHEFGAEHYDEEAQPLTQGAPGGFSGGFYPPPG
jgi:hypothetical protein